MNPQYPGGYGQGPEQNYGPPPGGGGQYDFIMGQGPVRKRSLVPGGGSLLVRLIIVSAIVIAVIILGIIGYTIATASQREYPRKLTGLAQSQQEIIRISGLGIDNARAVDTRNLATNTQLTVITDQAALLGILKNYKVKSSEKLLSAKASKTTDTELSQALSQNRYDAEFSAILNEALQKYKQELQALYPQAKTAKEKDLLQRSFDHMELLVTSN